MNADAFSYKLCPAYTCLTELTEGVKAHLFNGLCFLQPMWSFPIHSYGSQNAFCVKFSENIFFHFLMSLFYFSIIWEHAQRRCVCCETQFQMNNSLKYKTTWTPEDIIDVMSWCPSADFRQEENYSNFDI